jgi:hypothetical protein
MARTSTTITLDEPCAERWGRMARVPGGRHCAACQRTVVDFTRMSDAEVVAFLRREPTTCGRFTENQLDRPLLGAAEPVPRWRGWLTATAAALGLTFWAVTPARAQAPLAPLPGSMPQPAPPGQTPPEPTSTATQRRAAKADSLGLRGVVRNMWGWPIENARVTLRTNDEAERTFTASTDEHGRYELTLPPDVDLQNAELTFSRRLYRARFVTLNGATQHQSAFLRKRRAVRMAGSPRFR